MHHRQGLQTSLRHHPRDWCAGTIDLPGLTATTTALESADWWRTRTAADGPSRHALLAEPPARGSTGMVTFFQP